MDKLDIRIIREFLQGEPKSSILPARQNIVPALGIVAKRLGVAESTVRDRYAKLSGFFAGWSYLLNPRLTGQKLGQLGFDVPEFVSKDSLMEKLTLLDGMLNIVEYNGRFAAATFFYPDELGPKKKVDLIRAISGSEGYIFGEFDFPHCDLPLSRTDLEIIASRQGDMKKPNRKIAEEIGLSARTVKRRITKMVTGGAIWPYPSLNTEALANCVYCDLLLTYSDPKSRAEAEARILSTMAEYWTFARRLGGYSSINLILPSVPSARAVLESVRSVNGVSMARIDLIEKRYECYNILREQVSRKLTESSALARPVRVRKLSFEKTRLRRPI